MNQDKNNDEDPVQPNVATISLPIQDKKLDDKAKLEKKMQMQKSLIKWTKFSGNPEARVETISKTFSRMYDPKLFTNKKQPRNRTIHYHPKLNPGDLPLGMSPAMFSQIAKLLVKYFGNTSIAPPEALIFKGSSVTGVKYASKKMGKQFDDTADFKDISQELKNAENVKELPLSDYDMGLVWVAGFDRLWNDKNNLDQLLKSSKFNKENAADKFKEQVGEDPETYKSELNEAQQKIYARWKKHKNAYDTYLPYQKALELRGKDFRTGNFAPFNSDKGYLPRGEHRKIEHDRLCHEIEAIVGRPVNFAIYPNEYELQWHDDIFEDRDNQKISTKSIEFGDKIMNERGETEIIKNNKFAKVKKTILIFTWDDLKNVAHWFDTTYCLEKSNEKIPENQSTLKL